MSREILMLADALARRKERGQGSGVRSLEQALASATKKRFKEESTCVCRLTARRATTSPSALAGRDRGRARVRGLPDPADRRQDKIPDTRLATISKSRWRTSSSAASAPRRHRSSCRKSAMPESEQIISDFLDRKENRRQRRSEAHRPRQRHHRIGPPSKLPGT